MNKFSNWITPFPNLKESRSDVEPSTRRVVILDHFWNHGDESHDTRGPIRRRAEVDITPVIVGFVGLVRNAVQGFLAIIRVLLIRPVTLRDIRISPIRRRAEVDITPVIVGFVGLVRDAIRGFLAILRVLLIRPVTLRDIRISPVYPECCHFEKAANLLFYF